MQIMPTTVSSKDIQRNYRKIFNKVKRSKKPIIVLTNNVPDVVIMDIKELESLYDQVRESELEQALRAVKTYRKEKKAGKLKKLSSLKDLL